MEKFFEEGTLSEDDMRAGIRAGLVIPGDVPRILRMRGP